MKRMIFAVLIGLFVLFAGYRASAGQLFKIASINEEARPLSLRFIITQDGSFRAAGVARYH